MEPKQCEFEVTGGKPVVLKVQYDGKTYDVKVGVTVLAVRTKGELSPINNVPTFEVAAGMSVHAEEASNGD